MDWPDRSRLRALCGRALELAEEFRQHWLRVRLSGLSAEIAFYAVLGLFPAVIAFTAVLGSLDVIIGASAATDVQEGLLEWTTTTFGAGSTLHRTVADLFAGSNAGAVTVGAILTLYASSRGFVAVVRALDVVYGHEHRRRWLSTRLVGFTITIVTVVVFAITTAMTVVGPLLGTGDDIAERIGRGSGFATAWVWLRWPATFLVVVAWTRRQRDGQGRGAGHLERRRGCDVAHGDSGAGPLFPRGLGRSGLRDHGCSHRAFARARHEPLGTRPGRQVFAAR